MTIHRLGIATSGWFGLVARVRPRGAPPLGAAKVGETAPEFSVGQPGQDSHAGVLQGQVGRARVAQPGVPVRREALRQRQHAEAAEGMDRQGRRLADGRVVGTRAAGTRHGRRSQRVRGEEEGRADRGAAGCERRMGTAYGAKTTPHMFVISPDGMLVYNGAIDDNRSEANPPAAKNYVSAALTAAMAGKPVDEPDQRAVRVRREVRRRHELGRKRAGPREGPVPGPVRGPVRPVPGPSPRRVSTAGAARRYHRFR